MDTSKLELCDVKLKKWAKPVLRVLYFAVRYGLIGVRLYDKLTVATLRRAVIVGPIRVEEA
ncbi:MAG: hypothetical protein FWJ65_13255 [Limnochordales bacterium]